MRDRLASENNEEKETRLQRMNTKQRIEIGVLQYTVHGITVCATATPTVSTVFHPS